MFIQRWSNLWIANTFRTKIVDFIQNWSDLSPSNWRTRYSARIQIQLVHSHWRRSHGRIHPSSTQRSSSQTHYRHHAYLSSADSTSCNTDSEGQGSESKHFGSSGLYSVFNSVTAHTVPSSPTASTSGTVPKPPVPLQTSGSLMTSSCSSPQTVLETQVSTHQLRPHKDVNYRELHIGKTLLLGRR